MQNAILANAISSLPCCGDLSALARRGVWNGTVPEEIRPSAASLQTQHVTVVFCESQSGRTGKCYDAGPVQSGYFKGFFKLHSLLHCSGAGTNLKVGGGHRSGAKVGGTDPLEIFLVVRLPLFRL